jgi:protein involved in polysaccharide export with SLBB domain
MIRNLTNLLAGVHLCRLQHAAGVLSLSILLTGVVGGPRVVSGQENIRQGVPSVEASELPSPRFNQLHTLQENPFANSQNILPAPKPAEPIATPPVTAEPLENYGTGDPLEEYRRRLEEHTIRQEKAKAEARARFESRSLDLIPKPPAQPERGMQTPAREPVDMTQAGGLLDEQDKIDIELLPPPRATQPNTEDRVPSSSDLLNRPDRDLDDLLPPILPRDRKEISEPERKTPVPLKLKDEKPTQRPSRLGGGPQPSLDQPALPRLEPTKPVGDQPARTGAKHSEKEDEKNIDEQQTKESNPAESSEKRDRKQARSVLEQPIDPRYPNASTWTGLVEDELNRWPMPASHRPYMPVSQVTCSSCGGCVDRHGVGCCDKFGTCIGVGTRERRDCQCWRCPQGAPFNLYGPGGYAGPARSAPMPEYRLRAGDQIQLTFLIKTIRTVGSYRLVVGDELLIESDADANLTRGTLDRGLEIQPDGSLTLRFIGQVHAAGQTIEQLRDLLNDRYEEFYPDPAIDVTPVRTGNVARQIREAISGSEGFNPQQTVQTVTPEGTLRLPRLGAVPTQGLTMAELKREINLRYDSLGAGLEVEVMLQEQAPHYIYVLGEVGAPGRFEIDAPTTVLGSLSLAGSYVPGANLRQVVVFRRGPNWELLSTMLDLRGALLAKASRPPDEIWLQDGDVVIVPPSPIRLFDRFVQQVFTEGIYGIAPFNGFSIGNNN